MKRLLAILLCLVMLLALAACGNDETKNTDPSTEPSQSTTGSTETPTDGTTEPSTSPTEEPTTAPTDEPTTAPTDEPTTTPTDEPTTAPTEEPTTPPTEKPTTPTECSHTYKDATCTAAKTCTKCGATSGSALGHSYKDATCTAAKVCTRCNTTSGSAAGHSWQDATCSAPKTCSQCGTTSGNALGHSYKDATCTAAKTCTRCNATSGSATGHSWKDATCTVPKTCTKCGTTSGSATGHTLSAVCTTCGNVNAEYVEITTGSWGYIRGSSNISVTAYYFEEDGSVGGSKNFYIPLQTVAEENGMTIDEARAEYGETVTVFNGKEYVWNGSAWLGGPSFTYTVDGDTVTMLYEEEGWSSDEGYYSLQKTATLTRTGLAEFTVTGGEYFEIGTKLISLD